MNADVPMFGICLGHQILGLAVGGQTFKLKFGHRGANHPVKELQSGKVEITSQNHGFAVDPDSLPADTTVTHLNLYDGTVEGFRHVTKPIFSVQYHPEASPGPHDADYLFRQFLESMEKQQCRSRMRDAELSTPDRLHLHLNSATVLMPKRTDIKRVLVIGSGPIVIGQAASSTTRARRRARRCAPKGSRWSWSTATRPRS